MSKYKISFREGSIPFDIFKKLMYSAEYPYASLDLFTENRRMVIRTIKRLEDEGLITVIGKGQNKSIRVSKPGLKKARELFDDELVRHYLNISSNRNFRGEASRIWRNHRDAEVYTYFYQNGVNMLPSEKAELSISDKVNHKLKDRECDFHTSKEIKSLDNRQFSKVSNTRIEGLLVSDSYAYPVYNTSKGAIQWAVAGEMKAKIMLRDIIFRTYDMEGTVELDSAIIFGSDMQVAEDIFMNPHRKTSQGIDLISFIDTYDKVYFIPFSDKENIQYKMLVSRNWEDILIKSIFPETFTDVRGAVNAHVLNKEKDTYIFMFFAGDMRSLDRFMSLSEFRADHTYEILCFDWQEDFLERIIKEKDLKITIKSIEPKLIGKLFDKGNGD